MNKIFSILSDSDKMVFFRVITEENIAISFELHPDAVAVLKEKYSNSENWIHMLNGNNTIGSIKKVEGATISIQLLQYYSGNAETYDDSCYQKYTSPSCYNGIEIEIPIEHIKNIVMLKTKIS